MQFGNLLQHLVVLVGSKLEVLDVVVASEMNVLVVVAKRGLHGERSEQGVSDKRTGQSASGVWLFRAGGGGGEEEEEEE